MKELVIEESTNLQATTADIVTISGSSVYTKKPCSLIMQPAKVDTGIVFIKEGVEVPALISNVDEGSYEHTTSLEYEGVRVETVEHLLSAIWGMGIDNILIELVDGHIPFLSSSSEEYARTIAQAGIEELSEYRKIVKPKAEHYVIEDEESDSKISFTSDGRTDLKVNIDFDNIVGKQVFTTKNDPSHYLNDISGARSFMRSSLDSAGQAWQNVRKIFPVLPDDPKLSPIIVFSDNEFITPLKWQDEPARHKALDFVGDISLLGYRLDCSVELYKPGHQFTRRVVRSILADLTK